MGLNIENLFVQSNEQAKVVEIIQNYLKKNLAHSKLDWQLSSSPRHSLSVDSKRKLAISLPKNSWMAVVEAKNTIDFHLAKVLSEQLDTTIIIIQLYEVTGSVGYVVATKGIVMESLFSEEHDSPFSLVQEILQKYEIPFSLTSFKQVFKSPALDWRVI